MNKSFQISWTTLIIKIKERRFYRENKSNSIIGNLKIKLNSTNEHLYNQLLLKSLSEKFMSVETQPKIVTITKEDEAALGMNYYFFLSLIGL